jgi:hypothetical protein
MFVGRQEILRAVMDVLSSPYKNAITLFGQSRVGKTFVLKKLEKALNTSITSSESTIRYVPVYFDVMEHTHQSLDEIIKLLGEALCRKLRMNLPQWHTPSTQLLDWLVDLLQKDQEQALVILFDEFDSLDDDKYEYLRDEFFRYLKKLLAIDPKRLNIVFTIGQSINDFKTAQLLFDGIDNYRVSLLNQKDTEELIRLSEQNESLYWSKAAIQQVWQLTNGHPYLTQLFCSLIWDHYWYQHPKVVPTVTVNDVEDSEQLEAIVCSKVRDSLKLILGSWSPTTRQVLRQIKNQDHLPGFEKELNELAEQGIIVKKSNRWQIKVQIFEKCLDDIDFEP